MEMGVVSVFFKLNISGQPVGAVGYAYPYSQDAVRFLLKTHLGFPKLNF